MGRAVLLLVVFWVPAPSGACCRRNDDGRVGWVFGQDRTLPSNTHIWVRFSRVRGPRTDFAGTYYALRGLPFDELEVRLTGGDDRAVPNTVRWFDTGHYRDHTVGEVNPTQPLEPGVYDVVLGRRSRTGVEVVEVYPQPRSRIGAPVASVARFSRPGEASATGQWRLLLGSVRIGTARDDATPRWGGRLPRRHGFCARWRRAKRGSSLSSKCACLGFGTPMRWGISHGCAIPTSPGHRTSWCVRPVPVCWTSAGRRSVGWIFRAQARSSWGWNRLISREGAARR